VSLTKSRRSRATKEQELKQELEQQEKLELHPSEISKHTYRTGAGAALLPVNNSQRDSEQEQQSSQGAEARAVIRAPGEAGAATFWCE
jgi:hypothetical protein